MSLGSGVVPGAVKTPQPEISSPPIGLAGTGSGPRTGCPGFGVSEWSMAGGGAVRTEHSVDLSGGTGGNGRTGGTGGFAGFRG
jgi:hypothetical protein